MAMIPRRKICRWNWSTSFCLDRMQSLALHMDPAFSFSDTEHARIDDQQDM